MLGDSTKLSGGFLVVVILLGATALFTVRQLARTSTTRETATREYVENVLLAERLRAEEKNAAAVGRGFLITGSPEFLMRLRDAEARLDEALKQLQERIRSPQEEELVREVREAVGEYDGALRRAVASRKNNVDAAEVVRQFERDLMPRRQALEGAVDDLVAYKSELLERRYAQARAGAARASAIGVAAIVAAVALSSLSAWILSTKFMRAYQREREAVQVAERAVAAREELLGIVAHDLRSPISAISLKAAILRAKSTHDNVRRSGESIENIARRMEYVVRSLLDAASIEAGKFSVNAAPCSVSELLREAVETLGDVASAKSIRLELRPVHASLGVLADRDRVLQVLTNLIGNALKFTSLGGAVTINAVRAGETVRFSVADTGPGIMPEHVPHLFGRFWKAEQAGKVGSGLGLYIAKEIVDAHGGSIWVESHPGRGATFYFTLAFATLPYTGQRPDLVGANADV